MIRSSDISIVIQGDHRPSTEHAISKAWMSCRDAEIIVSTFTGAFTVGQRSRCEPLVDHWVESPDPGELPPTVRSNTAPVNNLNRQLVSTQAGIAAATRPYILKMRSDAVVDVSKVAAAWEKGEEKAPADPILIASRYTRHPDGINGYLFHASDWISFGRAERIRALWSAPLMPLSDATWFERHPHPRTATLTAKRFRARVSQEQWITSHYAKALGFRTPQHLTDDSEGLRDEYRRFLATHCVVADAEDIGLIVPRHLWAESSFFQDLDCVSAGDWEAIRANVIHGRRAFEPLRRSARALRHLIAAGILIRKRLSNPPAPGNAQTPEERNSTC